MFHLVFLQEQSPIPYNSSFNKTPHFRLSTTPIQSFLPIQLIPYTYLSCQLGHPDHQLRNVYTPERAHINAAHRASWQQLSDRSRSPTPVRRSTFSLRGRLFSPCYKLTFLVILARLCYAKSSVSWINWGYRCHVFPKPIPIGTRPSDLWPR